MALRLKVRILRKQGLAKGLECLVVILHLVSRRASVELNAIGLPCPWIFLERLLKMLVGLGILLPVVKLDAGRSCAQGVSHA